MTKAMGVVALWLFLGAAIVAVFHHLVIWKKDE